VPARNGNKLRAIRAARGIQVNELARLAGCSEATVIALEHGASTPRPITQEKIARALGLGIEDIWVPRRMRLAATRPLPSDPRLEPELTDLLDAVAQLIASAWRAKQREAWLQTQAPTEAA